MSDNKIFVVFSSQGKYFVTTLGLPDFNPLFSQELPQATDIHSILALNNRLYVVSTGTDEILCYNISANNLSNPRVIWRASSSQTDTHHINSIVEKDNEIFISAFGPKTGTLWSTANNGYIYNISRNVIEKEFIFQPHSLSIWNGQLYYCESLNGSFCSSDGPVFNLNGYSRGIGWISDNLVCVATSIGRKVSKSTGLIANPADPGEKTGECSFTIRNLVTKETFAETDLSWFGPEVYDLLVLPDGQINLLRTSVSTQLAERQAIQTLLAQITAKEAEKEQSAQALSAHLAEKEQYAQVLAAQVQTITTHAEGLTAQLTEKEETAKALSVKVAEKERTEQALSTQLLETQREKEQQVQALTAQVQAITTHAEGLTAKLVQQDQTLREIINSKAWKLMMILRKFRQLLLPKNSFQVKAVRFALAMGREVKGRLKGIILFLRKSLNYLQKNGLKETFLMIAYRSRRKPPKIKLGASAKASLKKVLERLNIPLGSEKVLSALINTFGLEKTSQIMANIVEVENLLSAPGKRKVFPLIQTSQLPPASSHAGKRNILFITGEFPSPYHGGGNRVLNFIKALSENNDIYLCTSFFPKEHEEALSKLAPYCRSIMKIPHGRFGGNQDEIRNWIGGTFIDIVHYEWPRSLENYDPGYGKIHIFTYMEAVSLRLLMDMDCLTPLSTVWLEKLEQLAYVLRLEFVCASKVDARIAVTRKDAEFFRNLYPFQKYAILNHGVDFEEFTHSDIESEPHTLVFVGNYRHYPNVDALEFFFNEVWENIKKDLPDIRIDIVGAHPPENITRMADGEHIFVTGTVADVRPYIQKASVCIAPLKSGAGERGKVIEYAALRRPFVATSLATTDLLFKDGVDYFCADTAVEFSEKVIALLKDPQLAKRMAETAYETARQNYDHRRVTGSLLSLYDYVEGRPVVK